MIMKITQKPARGGAIWYLGSCRALHALMEHCALKKNNTFAAQLLPYQRLADEWKNELQGEMHRSCCVS